MQTMKKQFFFFFSICACLNKNIAAISVADISILSVYSAVYGPRLTFLSLVCGKRRRFNCVDRQYAFRTTPGIGGSVTPGSLDKIVPKGDAGVSYNSCRNDLSLRYFAT